LGSVTFNEKSYFVDGSPVWLAAGEIHYFRLTRGDWRRRLLQLRLAGFNTVSTFVPWNFHEVSEGTWNFDGDRDVAAFFDTAAELGLYIIVRPGPYIGAEWQCGGIPPYIAAKQNLRTRTDNPQFLSYADKWFDRIAPIIAGRQIDANGRIILVQVENEYGHFGSYQSEQAPRRRPQAAWRDRAADNLRQFHPLLALAAQEMGGREPMLQFRNLCCNFGADALLNLDRAREIQPDAPLFATELWTAVFDWWGRQQSGVHNDVSVFNGTLETIAGGAAGLSIFMFSGGANFGYWHGRSIISEDCFVTTLYGPGAPILDDGSFSTKYAMLKKNLNGLMAGETTLAQCAQAELAEIGEKLIKAVRRSGEAQFIFYINRSGKQLEFEEDEKEKEFPKFAVPPGAGAWTVRNLPLGNAFTLSRTNAGLFAVDPIVVLYARAGGEISIDLRHDSAFDPSELDAPGFKTHLHENHLRLQADAPTNDAVLRARAAAGGRQLSIVLVNEEAIDRYWRLDLPDVNSFICSGPDRIEDAVIGDHTLTLKVSADEPDRKFHLLSRQRIEEVQPEMSELPARSMQLNEVQVCHRLAESTAGYDDSAWRASERPMPMTAFGNGYGWAWYRAKFTASEPGAQIVHIAGAADRGLVFVNGKFVDERGLHTHCGWSITLHLDAGEHTLALLIENLGMFSTGAELDIPLGEPKGLCGPVWVNGREITGWRMRAGIVEDEDVYHVKQMSSKLSGFGTPDEDILRGPLWLRAWFIRPQGFDGSARLMLEDGAIKGNAWLNGYNIGRYWKIGPQQSLWLPLSRLNDSNELMIFEESEIVPRRIRVHYNSFGYAGEIRIPKEQLEAAEVEEKYGVE